MNLKLAIARIRGLGAAGDALQHWCVQRLSAILLAPFSLWFIYSLTTLGNTDYHAVSAWLGAPLNAALLLIFILLLYYHAALGMQVVLEDYIASERSRAVCLRLVRLLMAVAALSAALAVLKVCLQ